MIKNLVCLLIVACANFGCVTKNEGSKSPDGYDLNKPEKFVMPESLSEISGICFYNENSDTVYAIQDEEGKVYKMALGVKKQVHSKFGKQGDYEDITIVRDKIVVLQSNGKVFSFPVAHTVYSEVDDVLEWKHLLPKGEYEAMFGMESTGSLYALCKNCDDDQNKDFVSGYIILLDDPSETITKFSIDVKSIRHITGKVQRGFRPSALAQNPVTQDWFILSAVNQLLVIADSNWVIKDVFPLSGNSFNQPEGIAFDKAGNMYISNEGDELSEASILKFKRL